MTLTRRKMLLGATLAPAVPGVADAAPDDAALARVFDAIAGQMLADQPETATFLGLDKGARAGLKAKLSDTSPGHIAGDGARCQGWLALLRRVPDAGLSPDARLDRQVVEAALVLGAGGARFSFGSNTLAASQNESVTPYVVNQMLGSFVSVPEMLDSQHTIATRADAEAYLARLNAFAGALDGESVRLVRDARQGVVAPDFILSATIGQMERYLRVPPDRQRLVTSLAGRARARGIAGDWAGPATHVMTDKVYPAIGRQLAALKRAATKATADAGVWKLPDGAAYYAWALKVGTTTSLTAAQIHRMGLERNRQLEDRMDTLLRKQGLTRGSAGARMNALAHDKRFLFPDTEKGRAQIIAYLNGRIAAIRVRMGALSALKQNAPVMVKQVPPDIQDGAPMGYMTPGSLDGARPAIYYINLKSTANWPRYALPTLTYHETIPGHAWQGAWANGVGHFPLIRQILSGFNAYVEGWALYAEQLADEIGMYDDDPFGQLGYLSDQKLRAGRLVVDTGIHALRWDRARAIAWLHECTGQPLDGTTSEIDRYCVLPGQACGYEVGHGEILRLRDQARAALGARFDLRAFNDMVVKAGAVPLTILGEIAGQAVSRIRSR